VKEINTTWENISYKMRCIEKRLTKLYKQLNSCKKYESYLKITSEISMLLRHKQVIKNITKINNSEKQRAIKMINADYTTK